MKVDDIYSFLNEAVPPSGTCFWRDWQERCLRLPADEAVSGFIDALKHGSEAQQYSALLGLRLFGFEATAEGYGSKLMYKIRPPKNMSDEIIKPEHTPADYEP
jgi:hypothetical protein